VRRSEGIAKTRTFVVTEGFGPNHSLGVFNNNVDTVERALIERYFLCKEGDSFRPAIGSTYAAWKTKELKAFQSGVHRHMPKLPVLTEQMVVDMYRGAKRKTYARALTSIMRRKLCDKDARLTMFVKFEKQDVRKAPRGINPRDPRFNLALGKYLKHAEKSYYHSINKMFGKRTYATVIKGMDAHVVASVIKSKWDLFSRPVAVGLDATKFDMHVSVAALNYEHQFYRNLFPDSQELSWLLSKQLYNAGCAYVADGKVEFEMQGTRASGDLNTSLGNCLLMCGLIHAYAAERGVDIELCNNGDDCVVIMEADQLQKFTDNLDGWFRTRGFAMAVERPCYYLEEIEFCQSHPVLTDNGYVMVRNLASVMRKDPMCLVPMQNDRAYKKWLFAVGDCGAKAVPGVPVHQAMYNCFRRNGTMVNEAYIQHVFKNTGWMQRRTTGVTTISAAARASYYLAFGILPDAQIALEQYYDGGTFIELGDHAIEREDLLLESGNRLLHHSNE